MPKGAETNYNRSAECLWLSLPASSEGAKQSGILKEMRSRMNQSARFPVLAVAALSLLAFTTGCNRLQARDQLNKGVQSYKGTHYEEAIGHFQKAVQLDPNLPMAKLYLATAYAQQVVPDLTTPENIKLANQAIENYKEVLQKDPNDTNSLKGIASLYFSTQKYDDAKEWQKKVLAADPKDAEAAYTIGVINWSVAHKNVLKELQPIGMNDDGQGNAKMPKDVCARLQQENGPLIEEGLRYLNQAVEIKPNYDDAMAYLNLLYRRKADIQCGDDAARKAAVQQAEDWRAKAMGTRKENEEKKSQQPGGIVMDASGQMK
jgi:tetratricopeptide (TPR) repeat protein